MSYLCKVTNASKELEDLSNKEIRLFSDQELDGIPYLVKKWSELDPVASNQEVKASLELDVWDSLWGCLDCRLQPFDLQQFSFLVHEGDIQLFELEQESKKACIFSLLLELVGQSIKRLQSQLFLVLLQVQGQR